MGKKVLLSGLSPGVTFTVASGASWLSVSKSGNEITATPTGNTSEDARSTAVTVTASDGATKSLPVTQEGMPTPTPTPAPTPTPTPAPAPGTGDGNPPPTSEPAATPTPKP